MLLWLPHKVLQRLLLRGVHGGTYGARWPGTESNVQRPTPHSQHRLHEIPFLETTGVDGLNGLVTVRWAPQCSGPTGHSPGNPHTETRWPYRLHQGSSNKDLKMIYARLIGLYIMCGSMGKIIMVLQAPTRAHDEETSGQG